MIISTSSSTATTSPETAPRSLTRTPASPIPPSENLRQHRPEYHNENSSDEAKDNQVPKHSHDLLNPSPGLTSTRPIPLRITAFLAKPLLPGLGQEQPVLNPTTSL
jgi:hypothetical protein